MRYPYALTALLLVSCADKDDCFEIREKASQNGKYYFLDRSGVSLINENRLTGQVSVSSEVYNQYSIGDDFCVN
tara:strand:+ start:148 stop:369 length:222 start_codon:yes stop_codon:yes gene_type:complete